MNRILVCAVVLIAAGSVPAVPAAEPESLAERETPEGRRLEFFEKRIRSLLVERCHKCHSAHAEPLKGGLRLDSRTGLLNGGDSGPAVVPGQPEQSELIRAVRYAPGGRQMPPDGKLSDGQIEDLTRWVELGAVWPNETEASGPSGPPDSSGDDSAKRWAFQPVRQFVPPPVHDTDWPATPIDRFILSKLEARGLTPAPPADRRTWLRRVYFNLIGLPPSPERVEAFLEDESPTAYQQVVDRLLSSPHYGERWGRHWLDLVRFAETAGNEFDYEIMFAWRYRDYVIRALNQDLPYDRFVVEHVAGDLLADPRRDSVTGTNESIVGTGFFWLGQAMQSPIDVLQEQYDTVENQIDVLSKTFLGLTVACARCHDHKFDPVSTDDYYALVGYLRSSRRQYAFIDDSDTTSSIVHQLETLDDANRHLVRGHVMRQLRPSLDGFAHALLVSFGSSPREARREPTSRESAEDARASDAVLSDQERIELAARDPSDFLHPWAVLRDAGTVDEFSRHRAELIAKYRSAPAGRGERPGDRTFEDFDDDYPRRWKVEGPAFAVPSARDFDVCINGRGTPLAERLVPRGFGHSGRISGKLRGTMRSQSFTIEKEYVDYRMVRTASDPALPKIDPGDLKDGQVHLIVDGLHLIRQPIYEGLTINVATDPGPRWYRQDVSKWLGHRAYIEITDEDNGFIAIDKIMFSDEDRPPREPLNPLVLALLLDETVQSREALARRYQQLAVDSFERWNNGVLAEAADFQDRVEVINWFLCYGASLCGDGAHVGDDVGKGDVAVDETLQLGASVSRPSHTSRRAVEAYIASRQAVESRVGEPTRALTMSDGTGEDSRVLVRGDHEQPGDLARRHFLGVLGGGELSAAASGSGREQMAARITSGSSPLLARVLVNRIWQHHFGRGIVPTPDDFGAMGQPPTHPELLDYLACEFIRGGWSMKRIHRMIVLSSAFGMSSRLDEATERLDPDNRLLHRMPVRRLEGEVIRDAILAVSGRLDRRMYGTGVLPHLTPFMEGRGRPEMSGPLDGDGRRSVYINIRRNFLPPMFVVFDYPAPQSTVGQRSTSNVPAQALTMLNNPFVIEQSRRWAERVRDECHGGTQSRIKDLYLAAFGRAPSEAELAAARDFLADQRGQYNGGDDDPRLWADLCHVLLNSREFIFVR